MKKNAIVGSVMLGLVTLGGCQTVTLVLLALLEQVQAYSIDRCDWEPTISTIKQIVDLNDADLDTALEIAEAICRVIDEPGPPPGAPGAPDRFLEGVRLVGHPVS